MRTKQEILNDLMEHAKRLDPQHYELAAVAMIETEVQIDIRDTVKDIHEDYGHLIRGYFDIPK